MEKTLVIIKPDAIRRGLIGRIISRFEDKDFIIKRIESRTKSITWCKLMYPHLIEMATFNKLSTFMTANPLIGIELEGYNIVKVIRKMLGCTNSMDADPGTIRGDFGLWPIRYNCVHASDSIENAGRELELFFND